MRKCPGIVIDPPAISNEDDGDGERDILCTLCFKTENAEIRMDLSPIRKRKSAIDFRWDIDDPDNTSSQFVKGLARDLKFKVVRFKCGRKLDPS
ncbi:hypothetical protein CEXT_433981 [Caerostris extrusa]|uniref:Uncharacterized protein n=1 Tax=Caerostris extrusa TaxID=172846 RepID=A0AAV4XZF4_CAEEX|nr:hypothetical protein CEXT_433981 [Caerostris extrusa]